MVQNLLALILHSWAVFLFHLFTSFRAANTLLSIKLLFHI